VVQNSNDGWEAICGGGGGDDSREYNEEGGGGDSAIEGAKGILWEKGNGGFLS